MKPEYEVELDREIIQGEGNENTNRFSWLWRELPRNEGCLIEFYQTSFFILF